MGTRGRSAEERSVRVGFGDFLRTYRQQLGLTQRELANVLEVHESLIAKIETGDRKPPRVKEFWDRLPLVPGLSPEAIATLREAAGEKPMPAYKALSQTDTTTFSGLRIATLLEPIDDEAAEDFTNEELRQVHQLIHSEIGFVVSDFLLRRKERQKRLMNQSQ